MVKFKNNSHHIKMKKTKEELEKEREYNLMLLQLFEEGAVIHEWQVPAEKPNSFESGYPEDLKIY